MAMVLSGGAAAQERAVPVVRIAELEIDPARLEAYTAAVKEEMETSVRVEPGVLAIYAVAEKDRPTRIRFFEMYADEAAYRAHIASPHFKKYFTTTQDMITSRKLIDTVPVQLSAKKESQSAPAEAKRMKIRLTVGEKVLTATLRDNETARDFASLLPLTLTLKEYAATEKISDLPRKLTTKGAPPGTAASAGDISYYAPWGNLALFHRDFGHSSGLVTLGKLDGDVEVLKGPGPLEAKVELVK
ncbi:cyclophilin-like fold protein [Corallococcus exercitus]|nr:cyclophilin-like fold protein [Corallococcus exercitus]